MPGRWEWLAIGLVLVVLVSSVIGGYGKSPTLSGETKQIIELAAEKGDYQTAKELFTNNQEVLGATTELEEKVYPEKAVERKIGELENKLSEYPENKEIYLMLADLYTQIDNPEQAGVYEEKARMLDPNNEMFR